MKTVRDYLKEGAGFLPSKSSNGPVFTQEYLDMPAEEFFKKAKGCHWILVTDQYEVMDEKP